MPGPIVSAAIHPGLGVARMGNSTEYILAPQVMAPPPRAAGSAHAADGTLKREAVEFRVYGYDATGAVVAELTAANARIDWTVELAAMKAHWYKFRAAMDLKGAAGWALARRNPDYPADRRADLAIRPPPASVSGPGAASGMIRGTFTYEDQSVPAEIGELRTDPAGRLHVLSGFGVSGSPAGLPVYDGTEEDAFGNASGWYDEACDGPVTARVTIDGREIPCEGAWAVIAPPNYAPDIIGWRTMLDLLTELWRGAGWIEGTPTVSFTRDIYPLLGRLSQLQWVNQGFVPFFGPGGPLDFENPAFIDRLARIHGPGDLYRDLRREIFNAFRPVSGDGVSLRSQPWIYGDAFGTMPASDPENGLPLWPAAAFKMRLWVAGAFDADWGQLPPEPAAIEAVPLSEQPAMLDRAPLHFCLADAFHPGCELTWTMRHLGLWEKPFRIRRRDPAVPEPDYGGHLTTAEALGPTGPLNAQGPGGLTRWMALPWQLDTAGCRSGYEDEYDPYVPTFWPARVPNQVLTEENYTILMDQGQTPAARLAAFLDRRSWYFPLAKYGTDDMRLMVDHFAEMGVVERRDGPSDVPGVPQVLYVETLPVLPQTLERVATFALAEPAELSLEDAAARQSGWRSDAQRRLFRAARMGHRLQQEEG